MGRPVWHLFRSSPRQGQWRS